MDKDDSQCADIDVVFFFFFKQKTAYEIYQCDWSSDVCSSDLFRHVLATHISIKPSLSRSGLDTSILYETIL